MLNNGFIVVGDLSNYFYMKIISDVAIEIFIFCFISGELLIGREKSAGRVRATRPHDVSTYGWRSYTSVSPGSYATRVTARVL